MLKTLRNSLYLFILALCSLPMNARAGQYTPLEESTTTANIGVINDSMKDLYSSKMNLRPQDVIPIKDAFYSLGTTNYRFKDAYVTNLNSVFKYKVGTFTSSGSTGNQSVTGVGFQPRLLILTMCRGNATAGGFFQASVGFATASNQVAAISVHSDPAASNAAAEDTNFILTSVSAGAYTQKGALVSMDSDGFTINWSVTSGFEISYIAIQ